MVRAGWGVEVGVGWGGWRVRGPAGCKTAFEVRMVTLKVSAMSVEFLW